MLYREAMPIVAIRQFYVNQMDADLMGCFKIAFWTIGVEGYINNPNMLLRTVAKRERT